MLDADALSAYIQSIETGDTQMTINDIIENCRLGGISLEQRLMDIEWSEIPHQREEAMRIRSEFDRRRTARPNPWIKAFAK